MSQEQQRYRYIFLQLIRDLDPLIQDVLIEAAAPMGRVGLARRNTDRCSTSISMAIPTYSIGLSVQQSNQTCTVATQAQVSALHPPARLIVTGASTPPGGARSRVLHYFVAILLPSSGSRYALVSRR